MTTIRETMARAEADRQVRRAVRYVGERRRDRNAYEAKIPWAMLDDLADALVAAGVIVPADAPNLGAAAARRVSDARTRAAARHALFLAEHRRRAEAGPEPAYLEGDA